MKLSIENITTPKNKRWAGSPYGAGERELEDVQPSNSVS